MYPVHVSRSCLPSKPFTAVSRCGLPLGVAVWRQQCATCNRLHLSRHRLRANLGIDCQQWLGDDGPPMARYIQHGWERILPSLEWRSPARNNSTNHYHIRFVRFFIVDDTADTGGRTITYWLRDFAIRASELVQWPFVERRLWTKAVGGGGVRVGWWGSVGAGGRVWDMRWMYHQVVVYMHDLHGCVHRLTMTGAWDEHDQYWLCCFANPSSIGLWLLVFCFWCLSYASWSVIYDC